MPITVEREKQIRKSLDEITDELIQQYTFIIELIEQKAYDKISQILVNHEHIVKKAADIFEANIENYAFAPLGKDLRRNISYTMIIKSLSEISNNCKNSAKFLLDNLEFKLDYNWISKFANKISSRLQLVKTVLVSEDPEVAYKIIEKDESVNKLYKDTLKKVFKKFESANLELTKSQNEKIVTEFILVLKSFELAADNLKEIAEMTLFISTGKLIIN